MCIVAIIREVLPCSRVSYAVNVVEGEMSSQDRRVVVLVRWYRSQTRPDPALVARGHFEEVGRIFLNFSFLFRDVGILTRYVP